MKQRGNIMNVKNLYIAALAMILGGCYSPSDIPQRTHTPTIREFIVSGNGIYTPGFLGIGNDECTIPSKGIDSLLEIYEVGNNSRKLCTAATPGSVLTFESDGNPASIGEKLTKINGQLWCQSMHSRQTYNEIKSD